MGTTEFFKTTGENLLKKVKELIDEGNVRRITVSEKSGRDFCIKNARRQTTPEARSSGIWEEVR